MRTLGLNECKTYTLVSPEMAARFRYENKENIVLPNPMSADKSVVRTTLIPSLINVYEYNKARKVENIFLYEISKTYDSAYNEDTKIAILMTGNTLKNEWHNVVNKIDFYYLKGIVENILDYVGLKNRYNFVPVQVEDLHPGIAANIILDREKVGIIGRVNPSILKDEVYVCEISMNKLNKQTKPIKYKPSSKYPSITKDMAFILDKNILNSEVSDTIKANGGKYLTNIEVFDVYEGEKIDLNSKSIAYSLTFNSNEGTLNDEEITIIFNKVIDAVISKFKAVLRDK